MMRQAFPVIDLTATGANILRLRKARGLSVRELQQFFGFEEPQAIYKWQRGQSLPTVDNLYALSALLGVPMNDILVPVGAPPIHTQRTSGRPSPAAHLFIPILPGRGGHGRIAGLLRPLSAAPAVPKDCGARRLVIHRGPGAEAAGAEEGGSVRADRDGCVPDGAWSRGG